MFVKPSSAFVGKPSRRRELLRQREERAVGEVVAVDEEELGVARGRVVEVELDAGERLRADRRPRYRPAPMARVPLLSGTRLVLATAPDDASSCARRRPREGVADVAAAVRDALRFPLEGDALDLHARGGTRATIVVEPPALPIPGVAERPAAAGDRGRRRRARAARDPDRLPDDPRRRRARAALGAARARVARHPGARAPVPRPRRRARRRGSGARRSSTTPRGRRSA